MITVTVNASKTYDIHIGSGLLGTLGTHIQNLRKVTRVCIVSDSNVFPLFGEGVRQNLEDAGFSVCSYVFPAGEEYKNAESYLQLLEVLAQNALTRNDLILALGGGVVGDLAGFAAATYLRGIPFVQVPTTLLAAVDSSVGGKTAIDLPAGKNLAGAFWQPSLVICDTDTLNTLPDAVFRDGCAEVIKYAVLYDPQMFALLEQSGVDFPREEIIARCIRHKAAVVAADEFDKGERMKLNLGHTIGHSIEKYSRYAVSHGKAVAIGMAIMARGTGCEDAERIVSLLEAFDLPTNCDYTPEELLDITLSDKKRSGNQINLIIPRRIGCCDVEKVSYDDVKTILKTGL